MKKLLTILTVLTVLFVTASGTVSAQNSVNNRRLSFFDNLRNAITSFFSEFTSSPSKSSVSKPVKVRLPDLVIDSVIFDPKLAYPIITLKNQGVAKPTSSFMVGYEWLKTDDTIIGGIHS